MMPAGERRGRDHAGQGSTEEGGHPFRRIPHPADALVPVPLQIRERRARRGDFLVDGGGPRRPDDLASPLAVRHRPHLAREPRLVPVTDLAADEVRMQPHLDLPRSRSGRGPAAGFGQFALTRGEHGLAGVVLKLIAGVPVVVECCHSVPPVLEGRVRQLPAQ